MDRFGAVVANWLGIMSRTKKLTFFTAYMAWWTHNLESCPSRDKG